MLIKLPDEMRPNSVGAFAPSFPAPHLEVQLRQSGKPGAPGGSEIGLFQAIMQMLAAWQHMAESPKPETPRDIAA